MSIVASTPLIPTPRDVALPESIAFSVTLSDTAAPPGRGAEQKLKLKLAPGNDLLFDPENAKEVERPKTISGTPTAFTFNARVKGTGSDLLSFRVTLLDESSQTVAFCLVGLL